MADRLTRGENSNKVLKKQRQRRAKYWCLHPLGLEPKECVSWHPKPTIKTPAKSRKQNNHKSRDRLLQHLSLATLLYHPPKRAFPLHECLRASKLFDQAIADKDNLVEINNCTEPMRDHYQGCICELFAQRLLDQSIGLYIYRAGRLIEKQDFRA